MTPLLEPVGASTQIPITGPASVGANSSHLCPSPKKLPLATKKQPYPDIPLILFSYPRKSLINSQ